MGFRFAGGASLALALLLLAGLAMRILGAWCYAATLKADHGIVCLMVKHLLEGGPIPIFYYGQAYLGAFEPWVSTVLCACFGMNGFWINMGTALVAFAFLPLVYAWGKGAGGRLGGLAALAFCVIGPPVYFQFEGWAYGGYAAIPLLNCAVLLLTIQLLVRERRAETGLQSRYFLLGAVAGLGWWQSPLLMPAFLTAALALLAVLRGRIFSWRVLAGAGGFFLASAPMWIWNWRHGWQTLDMLSTAKRPPFLEGLRLFYLVRLPELLEFSILLRGTKTIFAALLIVLLALALVILVRRVRERSGEKALHLGFAVFYALLMSILFTLSHYAKVNALRYELVMIPVLGVMIGTVTAWLVERTRWGLGWLPLLALIALQAEVMPNHFRERDRALAFERKVRDMAGFLRARGIRHVYADYQLYRASHGLNFMLNEEFVFSAHAAEKYKPYKIALELAEQPAVLNDMMGFHDFLTATRGTAETAEFNNSTSRYNRIELRYAIRPPSVPVCPVPEFVMEGVYDAGSSNRLGVLTDDSFATGWKRGEGPDRNLEVRLKSPRSLGGVRLVGPERGWPGSLRVEGWEERQGLWRELRPMAVCTRFFWSGPRFYWGGAACRMECRFEPVTTSRLRLRLTNGTRYGRCDIAEIQALEVDEAPGAPGADEWDRVLALLEERSIGRVYCDRWEANRLQEKTNGRLRLPLDINAGVSDALPPEMTLDGSTAVLVQRAEVGLVRRAFASRFVTARETEVGRWTLFDFPGPSVQPLHGRQPGLRWVGFGCLMERDGEWAKAAAFSALGRMDAGDPAGAKRLAEKALALAPADAGLAGILSRACDALGDAAGAQRYRALKERLWPPQANVSCRFANGMKLSGVSVESGLKPGGMSIRYYWSAPEGSERSLFPAYVHVLAGGRMIAQDDHVVELPASDMSVRPRSGQEEPSCDSILSEERNVALKGSADTGIQLEIGMVDLPNEAWPSKWARLFDRGPRKVVIPVPPRK